MDFSPKRFANAAMIAIAILFCSPEPSFAQQPGAALSPDAKKAMKRGYIAGRQSEWALAIKYFEKAYKLEPSQAEVLFNLALAIDRSGRNAIRAMALYGGFLAVSPNAANAEQIRDRIIELDVKVEAEVLKLIRQAQSAVGTLPEKYTRESKLESIAEALTLTGNLEEAMSLASKGDADDTYKKIATAQAKLGDASGAFETAGRIGGEFNISVTYQYVSKALARQGKFAEAIEAAERTIRPDHSVNAYITIAKEQIKRGQSQDALEVLITAQSSVEKMPSKEAYDEYSEIAMTRVKAGDLVGAELAAGEILKSKNYYVNRAYNAIIKARAKSGDFEGAERIIKKTGNSAAAYKTIVRAALKTKNWAVVIRNLRQPAKEDSDFYSMLDSIIDTVKAAPQNEFKHGQLQTIRKKLISLGAFPLNGALLATLARYYIDMGDTKAGLGLIAKAKTFLIKKQRKHWYDAAILNGNKIVVQSLSAVGRLAEARKHVAKISPPKTKALLHIFIAKDFARRGELKTSRILLKKTRGMVAAIKEDSDRYSVLDKLKDAFISLGERGQLEDVLSAMEKNIQRNNNASNWDYSNLGNGWLRTGNVRRARALVPRIKDIWYKNTLLSGIATHHSRKGDFEAAKKVAKTITRKNKISELLKIEYDQRTVYRALQAAQQTRKAVERALSSLKLKPADHVAGQVSLTSRLGILGDLKSARILLNNGLSTTTHIAKPKDKVSKLDDLARIANADSRSIPISQLILHQLYVQSFRLTYTQGLKWASSGYLRLEEPHEAAHIASQIKEIHERVRTLIEVAQKLIALGAKKSAVRLLERTAELAANIEKANTRIPEMSKITNLYVKLGNVESARKMLALIEDLRKAASPGLYESIKSYIDKAHIALDAPVKDFADLTSNLDDRTRARLLAVNELIRKKSPDKAGKILDQAFKLARNIATGSKRSERLASIARSYVRLGQLKKAATITRRLPPYYAVSAYRQLSSAYVKKGDKKTAGSMARAALKAKIIFQAAVWPNSKDPYDYIAYTMARAGDVDTAAALIKREPDITGKIKILVYVGQVQARLGDEVNAMKLFTKAWRLAGDRKSGFPDWANYEMAVQRVYAKDFEQAREYLLKIQNPYWKSLGYEKLAQYILTRSAKTLEAAMREAEHIPNPAIRDRFARKAVDNFLKQPADIFSALKSALTIEDSTSRDSALHSIAMVQVHSGDAEGALDTANNMSADGRFWTIRAVAWAQYGEGDIKAARETLNLALDTIKSMARPLDRKTALSSIELALKAWSPKSAGKISNESARKTSEKPIVSLANWVSILSDINKKKSLSNMRTFLEEASVKSAGDMIGELLKAAKDRAAMVKRITALQDQMMASSFGQ